MLLSRHNSVAGSGGRHMERAAAIRTRAIDLDTDALFKKGTRLYYRTYGLHIEPVAGMHTFGVSCKSS